MPNPKLRCDDKIAGSDFERTECGPQGEPQGEASVNCANAGVTVREAWNTSKSAHGPWHLSKTPALSLALPARIFSRLGLPSLAG